MIKYSQEQLTFSTYPAVDIISFSRNINRTDFNQYLNDFSLQQDSLIARRIVQPNIDGKVIFEYEFYGDNQGQSGLKEASIESTLTSDLANSYLIVSGNLSLNKLQEALEKMGGIVVTNEAENVWHLTLSQFKR